MKSLCIGGLKGGILIDSGSGSLRYMLWYCGSIFHEVLYFIQIGYGDTVKLSGKKSGSIEIESDLQAFLDQLENSDHNKAKSISSRTYWIKGEKSYIHISVTCIINILRNFQFRKSCQLMPDELKVDYVFFRERLESNISMKSSLSILFLRRQPFNVEIERINHLCTVEFWTISMSFWCTHYITRISITIIATFFIA